MSQPPIPQRQPYQPVPTASPKSPGVAAILSAVIPGVGHLYTGNPFPALLWFSTMALTPTGGHLVREDVHYGKSASGVHS